MFKDWRLTGPPLEVDAVLRPRDGAQPRLRPLTGVPVPLYVLDDRNTLLEPSTFRARYDACPSRPLPPTFKRGKKASVCLVYFAPDHGKLVAVSFRPTQDFDAITWRGPVVEAKTK